MFRDAGAFPFPKGCAAGTSAVLAYAATAGEDEAVIWRGEPGLSLTTCEWMSLQMILSCVCRRDDGSGLRSLTCSASPPDYCCCSTRGLLVSFGVDLRPSLGIVSDAVALSYLLHDLYCPYRHSVEILKGPAKTEHSLLC